MAKDEQWITVNGRHVLIGDGESATDAINRSIANKNAGIKAKQIEQNKEQADRLNKKSSDKTANDVGFVQNQLKEMVQKLTDAGKDKTLSVQEKKALLSEFKHYLNENVQVYEKSAPSNSHILNVTGNRAWYQNKSGTLIMLAPNGHWLKFNNDLSVTDDGKISTEGRARVQALADELHTKKGWKK